MTVLVSIHLIVTIVSLFLVTLLRLEGFLLDLVSEMLGFLVLLHVEHLLRLLHGLLLHLLELLDLLRGLLLADRRLELGLELWFDDGGCGVT